MSVPRFFILFPAVVLALSCNKASNDSRPLGFGMKVMFLDSSGAVQDFPTQITKLTIKVTPYPMDNPEDACECDERCTKDILPEEGDEFVNQSLDDYNNDGIFEEAVIENLPADCPFALEVMAFENHSKKISYYGRVDGIKMQKGRRLFLKMMLYHKNSQIIPLQTGWGSSTLGVFGHTATRLDRGQRPDYRVLIAGGFSDIQPSVCGAPPINVIIDDENCPAPNTPNDCFRCFIAVATNDLHIFEQGSSTLIKPTVYDAGGHVHDTVRLSQPRALHTATLLADGRVLMAGGVDRAAFIFKNNDVLDGDDTWHSGWELAEIKPLPGDGFLGALNTFDLFNGEFNPDELDMNRDGDFERGGLQLLTGMENPMGSARFLHAAVHAPFQYPEDPIKEKLVLHIGGMSGDLVDPTLAPRTVDLFEADNTAFSTMVFPNLYAQRMAPAAARGIDLLAGGRAVLWIFGGVQFPGYEDTPNNAIAEKWTRNDLDGSWSNVPVDMGDDKPEYVRLYADALPLTDDGLKIMLAGWYGARCVYDGVENPTYVYEDPVTGDPILTHICSSADVSNNCIIDVGVSPPSFTPGPEPGSTARYAMGSTILLGLDDELGTREKWVLQSGGIANTDFIVSTIAGQGAVELYKPVYTAEGTLDTYNAIPSEVFQARLNSPRMWHRAVELKGGNVLFIGGVKFEIESSFVTLIDSLEMLVFEGHCGDGFCESDSNSVAVEWGTCPVDHCGI